MTNLQFWMANITLAGPVWGDELKHLSVKLESDKFWECNKKDVTTGGQMKLETQETMKDLMAFIWNFLDAKKLDGRGMSHIGKG